MDGTTPALAVDIATDYQELLGRGYVLRRYANAVGWLDGIHAQARADALRVDSTISPSDPELVWAVLRRSGAGDLMYETARIMLVREIAIEASRSRRDA
jgi:hypothetical protein